MKKAYPLLMSLVSSMSCQKSVESEAQTETVFPELEESEDILPSFLRVLDQHCNTCHINEAIGNFKKLRTNADWTSSQYILAGQPKLSPLYLRLQNNGGDMPFNTESLSIDDFQIIERYILSLDPENQSPSYRSCNQDQAYEPSRIRRLTPREYEKTLQSLSEDWTQLELSSISTPHKNGHYNLWQDLVPNRLQTEADLSNAELASQSWTLPENCMDEGDINKCWSDMEPLLNKIHKKPLGQERKIELETLYQSFRLRMGHSESLRSILETVLMSPEFLYRTELGERDKPLSSFEIAHSLSYFLTASPPDQQLWQEAQSGRLTDPKVRRMHAQRIMKGSSFRESASQFITGLLDLNQDLYKDPEVYPSFSLEVATKMRAQSQDRLDQFFSELEKHPGNLILGQDRSILTSQLFNSIHAHPDQSSPIMRGKIIATRLLCINLPSPPPDISPLPNGPEQQDLTSRERVEAHVSNESCRACHSIMDPLGFSLEHYDGVGQYREMDKGKRVDSSGRYQLDSHKIEFQSIRQLEEDMASSTTYARCFHINIYRHLYGQLETQLTCQQESSFNSWLSGPQNLQDVYLSLIESDAFINRSFD